MFIFNILVKVDLKKIEKSVMKVCNKDIRKLHKDSSGTLLYIAEV